MEVETSGAASEVPKTEELPSKSEPKSPKEKDQPTTDSIASVSDLSVNEQIQKQIVTNPEEICGIKYSFTDDPQIFQEDGPRSMHLCNFCSFKCEDKEEFINHMSCHVFFCEICSFQAFRRFDIILHVVQNHPESSHDYKHLKCFHFVKEINKGNDKNSPSQSDEGFPQDDEENESFESSEDKQEGQEEKDDGDESVDGADFPKNAKFECPKCKETVDSPGEFKIHFDEHFPNIEMNKVHYHRCLKAFKVMDAKSLLCEYCNRVLPDIHQMDKHINIHLQNKVGCQHCSFKTSSQVLLSNHNEQKHPDEPIKIHYSVPPFNNRLGHNMVWTCLFEGKMFKTRDLALAHHQECHIDKRVCPMALKIKEKTLVQESIADFEAIEADLMAYSEDIDISLNEQDEEDSDVMLDLSKSSNGEIQRPWSDSPPQKSKSRGRDSANLSTPISINSSGSMQAIESDLEMEVEQMEPLNEHMRVDENHYYKADREMYNCHHCQYTTKNVSHMKEHVHVHTGFRRWQCAFCRVKSDRKSLLVKHMKMKHQREQAVVYEMANDGGRELVSLDISYTPEEMDRAQKKGKTKTKKTPEPHFGFTDGHPIKCNYCEFMGNGVEEVHEHMNACHTTVSVHISPEAGGGLVQQNASILRHIVTSTPRDETNDPEDLGQTDGPMQFLQIKVEPDENEPGVAKEKSVYQCIQCEFCSDLLSMLKIHMSKNHDYDILYVKDLNNLDQSGAPSIVFLCEKEECEFASSTQRQLYSHMNDNPSHFKETSYIEEGMDDSMMFDKMGRVSSKARSVDKILEVPIDDNVEVVCKYCTIAPTMNIQGMKAHVMAKHVNKELIVIDKKAKKGKQRSRIWLCPVKECIYGNYFPLLMAGHVTEHVKNNECSRYCLDMFKKYQRNVKSAEVNYTQSEFLVMQDSNGSCESRTLSSEEEGGGNEMDGMIAITPKVDMIEYISPSPEPTATPKQDFRGLKRGRKPNPIKDMFSPPKKLMKVPELSKKGRYFCQRCGFMCNVVSEMKTHVITNHFMDMPHMCVDLEARKNKKKSKLYFCKETTCEFSSYIEFYIQNHKCTFMEGATMSLDIEKSGTEKMYQCSYCPLLTTTYHNILTHVVAEHDAGEDGFIEMYPGMDNGCMYLNNPKDGLPEDGPEMESLPGGLLGHVTFQSQEEEDDV